MNIIYEKSNKIVLRIVQSFVEKKNKNNNEYMYSYF